MTKVWRIVLWIAVAILAIGLVLAGVGFLTGASTTRIVELTVGGKDRLLAQIGNARGMLLRTLQGLRSTILGIF